MILVNGGTGFIGSEVVRYLAGSGVPVRVMTRDPGKGNIFIDSPKVDIVEGSVKDIRSLELAMEDVSTVVNCVQHDKYPMEQPRRGLTFLEIDGAGTKNQVEAALRAGVSSFIYVSGAGVGTGKKENWFQGKEIAERAVRESGLDFLILRPTWIFGPGDRSVNKFVWFAKRLPFIPIIGDGSQRVQPLFIKDLARIIGRAAQGEGPANRVFEIGGPDIFSMREMVEKLLDVLEKKKPIIPQPVTLMRIISRFLRYIPGSTLSPEVISFALQEAVVDNRPVLEAFPLELTSFENGLRHYIH